MGKEQEDIFYTTSESKFALDEETVSPVSEEGLMEQDAGKGSACDSVNTRVSHVVEAIGVPDEYANGTIRISFGTDNDEDDAAVIAKTLIDIIIR